MENFAFEIIRSARTKGAPDDTELLRIQQGCIIALKNAYSKGGNVSMEEEIEVVTRAIEDFTELSEGTIFPGRKHRRADRN